jgi:hypothetical protein
MMEQIFGKSGMSYLLTPGIKLKTDSNQGVDII